MEVPERKQRMAEIETKIDSLLLPLAGLGRLLEQMQRLLKGFDSLAVGPSLVRKPARFPPISCRLACKACLGEMTRDILRQSQRR